MTTQGRENTRLRYRFSTLEQARAHVHEVDGRALFYLADRTLRFLPESPVFLTFAFDQGSTPRLLHGKVACAAENGGTWVTLSDTRPLEAEVARESRKDPRHGCDVAVEVRSDCHAATGRMLDLSAGGARLTGVEGFAAGDRVELRLVSSDRLIFHDLSYAQVIWAAHGEIGVQFDRSDVVGRYAVTRLLTRNEELWGSAWEGQHPPSCCGGQGVTDPKPPRLSKRAAG